MHTLKIPTGYKDMESLIGDFSFTFLYMQMNIRGKKRQIEPEICLSPFYTHILDNNLVPSLCLFFNDTLEISAIGTWGSQIYASKTMASAFYAWLWEEISISVKNIENSCIEWLKKIFFIYTACLPFKIVCFIAWHRMGIWDSLIRFSYGNL